MASRSDDRICYEFDEFFVDPVRRLLQRGGEPVSVTPKALSILIALLQRPGEVVEKAELIEAVWGGAHVSEANLTQNVFSLRKSLGERANEPRYVVTVPGRGYSFGAEVRRIERAATGEFPLVTETPSSGAFSAVADSTRDTASFPVPAAPPQASHPSTHSSVSLPAVAAPVPLPPTVEAPAVEAVAAEAPAEAETAGPRPRTARRMALAAAVLAAVVVAVLLLRPPHGRRTAAATAMRRSIAVLDFRDLSPGGETKWLQTALPEMLTTELAAGGTLRVLRGEPVSQAQRGLTFTVDGGLARGDLQRIHELLGADLVVVGSYVPMGGKIRLDLRVLRAPEADAVVSLAEVGTEPGLFDLVSRTGAQLRRRLGVAALSSEQARQARALQPASPAASRFYNEGLVRLRAFDPPGALRLLRQAAAADPDSAVVHSELAHAWSLLGEDARAEEEARRAVALAGPLSREQRLAIEGRLRLVRRKWDEAAETYRSLWTFFPDEIEYGLQLADSLTNAGRGSEAAATLDTLRKLPPPVGQDPRIDLAEARNARRLSDVETERRAAETAEAKGRKSGQTLVVSRALIYRGDALVQVGRQQEALALFGEAQRIGEKAGYSWEIGMAVANRARALKLLGDLAGAEKADEESLAIAQKIGSGIGIAAQLYGLGDLRLQRGELGDAQRLLEQARARYEELGDRVMQARVLGLLGRARGAQGDLAGARQGLEESLRIAQSMSNRVEAVSLDGLGEVLAIQGDLAGARSRYEAAFAVFRRTGEENLAASSLSALADVEARLGDPRAGWERSTQALAVKQRTGDRVGVARILGSRSHLAFARGDLAAARSLAAEQLRLSRQVGARLLAAQAQRDLGRIALAAGDLAAARAAFEDSLGTASILGADLLAAEIRLDLARLALAAGRAAEATLQAREVASWFRERRIDGGEGLALTVLGEALLAQGLRADAVRAEGQARERLAACQDRELLAEVAAPLARLAAADGRPGEALRDLRQALAEDQRMGLVAPALEARLALGQIQRRMGDPAGAALLGELRRDAEARGFRRVSALAAGPAAPGPTAAPLG